ncbi:hypothetical protein I7I50_11792 [Histoplasma capsulatum G186AR]|uniref:Uncharacterized protein n=1 Tax=Ajellomyces capsulatus TaxID=5037 RepID=A0A8H7ZBN4_AJECA|nr:hypothetical protein I7I52_03030 [Histoplasma capsulatum]QSS70232.1 hypothetical protein I7I50_11792 [Histoplasma capsulatum G186AR]
MHNARGNGTTSSARCRRRIQKAPDSTMIPRLKNNPSTQAQKNTVSPWMLPREPWNPGGR